MTDILNIRGLELDPARTAEADDGITIGIKRRPEPDTICHHCYANRLAPNGARIVSYADLPVRGKPVTLEWDRQRYLCGACGKSVPDSHRELHDEFMMTRRLYEWIGSRSMDRTFASVAEDVRLDERTVRRVFEHWADAGIKALDFETPKIMGIDEVHLLHAARGILTNIGEKTVIDLLPDRNYKTMATRISAMKNRERIEVLAMDMWPAYRKLAERDHHGERRGLHACAEREAAHHQRSPSAFCTARFSRAASSSRIWRSARRKSRIRRTAQ